MLSSPRLQRLRTHRQRHRHDARVPCLQLRRKPREDGHGRGHRAQAQRAARVGGVAAQVLLQHLVLVQHALGGGQHALAFGRKAFKAAAPAHHHHAKFFFQRTQRVGQGRLRDVAGLRGAAKVPVLVQRHQVAQGREQVHGEWGRLRRLGRIRCSY